MPYSGLLVFLYWGEVATSTVGARGKEVNIVDKA